MKEYKNEYPSFNDLVIYNAKRNFDLQRNNPLVGKSVIIKNFNDDDIQVNVLIKQHTNPLNEDKEDRKMFVPSDIDIHRGSIVEWNTETWMVTNEVTKNDDNGVYVLAKILKCNNSLKYYLPSNFQQLCNIPCIETNLSMYSMGVDEGRIITTENGKRFVTVAYNNETKELKNGMRFILNEDAYSITEIYKGKVINGQGILEIKLQSCAKSDKDNFEKGIAYNENNDIKITILNGQNITLNKDKTLQLNVEVLNNNKKINNPVITYISGNENITTIDKNGLITTLAEGTSTITAMYQSASTSIKINVVSEPIETHNYTVIIKGSDQAYLSWDNKYSCEFRDNGVAIEGIKAIWKVFAEDGTSSTNLATIKSQTGNSCVLRGNDDYKFGYVILQCQSEDGKIKNTKKIEIISAL